MSTIIDTDRIALSHELSNLAERFAIEASMWAMAEAKSECERVARYLAQLSRSAITTGDIQTIDAYAEAARILVANVEGVRRFFQCINTQPSVRRR